MIDSQPDIVTIKGAPGTGKTQTAKCLSAYYPTGVRLEIDTLRSMVVSVAWTDQEEHIRLLSLSIDLVRGFLRLGYRPVIVVDTFSGDKLDKYIADIHSLDESLVIRSFALITDSDVLVKRLESRQADEFKNSEISIKLNIQVIKHLHQGEILIDTTNSSPMETAEEIYKKI